MGSGNMGTTLTDFVKSEYSEFKQDLYACFVRRGMDLSVAGGVVAVVTGDTWLSIKSFEGLRHVLLNVTAMKSLVHIRDSGNLPSKFGANTAYVFSVGAATKANARTIFVRTSLAGVEAKREQFQAAISQRSGNYGWYEAAPVEFGKIPSAPIAYWLSDGLVESFSESLLDAHFLSGGRLKTHNDARYVR